jgi:hypothetical protein
MLVPVDDVTGAGGGAGAGAAALVTAKLFGDQAAFAGLNNANLPVVASFGTVTFSTVSLTT